MDRFDETREYEKLILPKMGRGPFRERPLASERIKDYKPTKRQIRWMSIMIDFGPQSTLSLHESDQPDLPSYDGTKDAIKKLWRAGFVYRPAEQTDTTKAERNYYIYDITEKGEKLLKDLDLWREPLIEKSDWRHKYGLSACLTSLALCAKRDGSEMTFFEPTPRYHPIPFYWGNDIIHEVTLKPDHMIVLNGVLYFVEFDRGTERHEPTTWKRKSTRRTLLQYDYLIGQKVYQKLYNTKLPAKLLFITVSGERGNAVLDLAQKLLIEPDWVCVNFVQGFGKHFKPPKQLFEHLYNGHYYRPGFPPYTIKKETTLTSG